MTEHQEFEKLMRQLSKEYGVADYDDRELVQRVWCAAKTWQREQDRKQALKEELGDVLWYLANLASDLDLSLEDIAKMNLEKLKSRQVRGVLGGEGDNR